MRTSCFSICGTDQPIEYWSYLSEAIFRTLEEAAVGLKLVPRTSYGAST